MWVIVGGELSYRLNISILVISCGPLLKKEEVMKTSPAQNYLEGDVATFSCKPKYYIHGDIERRCVNGT